MFPNLRRQRTALAQEAIMQYASNPDEVVELLAFGGRDGG
jgi:hypothetical protein